MLRTAVISVSLTRHGGGLFDSLVGSCRELAAIDGVSVRAFGQQDDVVGDDLSRWDPVPVSTFPGRGPRAFGYASAMKRAVMDGDFDLIHTHGLWGYPSLVAPYWHSRTERPYLVSPHGMLDPWAVRNSRWKKRIASMVFERNHLHQAACIRALCESEARSIRAYGLRNPICIIPNGIDLPDEQREIGDQSSIRPKGFGERGRRVLLYLGRLHPKKGLAELVRAWGMVQQEGSPARDGWLLAIAGWEQGGHEAELKRLATECDLSWRDVRQSERATAEAHVHSEASLVFLGPLFGADKTAAYDHCDAFVLPSFSEGLPMVVLEAWAHRKPVLMTDFCNLPEGFEAGAALRIEPDAASIARALNEWLLADAAQLKDMGDRGRRLVAARFTWTNVAHEMHQVYRWLTGQSAQPACVLGTEELE